MGLGPRWGRSVSIASPRPISRRSIPTTVWVNPPNPDPNNCRILSSEKVGRYLIVLVHYPDCTNFEGHKVLVYRDVHEADLRKQKAIDPHFSDSQSFLSPIARFHPTAEGMDMARRFATTMTRSKRRSSA